MRTRCQVWLALAVFAVLAVDPVVTSAQPIIGRARWCATLPFGGMMQCSYSALEHCMTYARGVSNQCSLNPWYEGPPNPPRKRPRRGASTLGPHWQAPGCCSIGPSRYGLSRIATALL